MSFLCRMVHTFINVSCATQNASTGQMWLTGLFAHLWDKQYWKNICILDHCVYFDFIFRHCPTWSLQDFFYVEVPYIWSVAFPDVTDNSYFYQLKLNQKHPSEKHAYSLCNILTQHWQFTTTSSQETEQTLF